MKRGNENKILRTRPIKERSKPWLIWNIYTTLCTGQVRINFTISLFSWALPGVTTNLILSRAIITTENEAKNTKTDWEVAVILQRTSWKIFVIIFTIEVNYVIYEYHLAWSYRPIMVNKVQQSERHCEETEENIRDRHVGNQNVAGGPQ